MNFQGFFFEQLFPKGIGEVLLLFSILFRRVGRETVLRCLHPTWEPPAPRLLLCHCWQSPVRSTREAFVGKHFNKVFWWRTFVRRIKTVSQG